MRVPQTERVGVYDGDFASAREKARDNEFTGVLSVENEGFVVFLGGIAVYARTTSSVGEDALSELGEREKVTISASPEEKVKMFLTYTRYIDDEALLRVEPVDGSSVDATVLENVLIDGVRKDRAVTWRGETQDTDKSILPTGKVTAFARSYAKLFTHVSEKDASGYAVRSGEVATFVDGENVDRKQVEVPDDLVKRGGWTLVQPEGSDSGSSSEAETDSEATEDLDDNGGLLGGVFS